MMQNPAQKMVSYLEGNPNIAYDGALDANAQGREKEAQVVELIKKLRKVVENPQGTAKEFRAIYDQIEDLECYRKYGDLRPALDFLKEREKGGQ